MYGMDAGMGGMMKKIAAKKAKKKDESGTSKIGKMLEKKEMSNAKRMPFMTKMKKGKK
jgi:hypothetical protein